MRYTKEMCDFIAKNVNGKSNIEMTDDFNKKFHTTISVSCMKSYKKNHKLSSGLTGRFEKGNIPVNKGIKKGFMKANKTSFKKGHVPKNHLMVGSERLNRDGYVEIKTAEPNKWQLKHRMIWESENGLVPKNHCIIFLDSNKRNIKLDNIMLVHRKKLLVMNREGLIYKNSELTKSGGLLADLQLKIKEQKM